MKTTEIRALCLEASTTTKINHLHKQETRDKFVIEFKDGTRIEYDRTSHNLKIHVTGKVEIKATDVVGTGETVTVVAGETTKIAGSEIAISGYGLAFYDSSGYAVLIVRKDCIWFNGQKIIYQMGADF